MGINIRPVDDRRAPDPGFAPGALGWSVPAARQRLAIDRERAPRRALPPSRRFCPAGGTRRAAPRSARHSALIEGPGRGPGRIRGLLQGLVERRKQAPTGVVGRPMAWGIATAAHAALDCRYAGNASELRQFRQTSITNRPAARWSRCSGIRRIVKRISRPPSGTQCSCRVRGRSIRRHDDFHAAVFLGIELGVCIGGLRQAIAMGDDE